ncbi:replication initiation protein [Lacticaseibacillus paracasei]|uniref:replication initiation protein n=1 Tax=Lacticaseibacillus paracasei TaxID=1597 RepID=UPI0031F5BD44
MSNTINRKQNLALQDLLSRQDYLITQGNDLARAFGNLSAFEHKILDYCFSFVKQDSVLTENFTANTIDILHHLALNASGQNYHRVADAFKRLNENTALYMAITTPKGKRGIRMTSLFSRIDIIEDGEIKFKFSEDAAPYVFQLRKNYYSFHLSELANVRSKHALTLMKLWNANSNGKLQNTTIVGNIDDWQAWFLGNVPHWPAGRFKDKVINKAINELGNLYPKTLFILTTQKRGRKVVGYQLDISNIHTNLKLS